MFILREQMHIMLRSSHVWLVSITLALVGFGPGVVKATAQTTYTFSASYDVLAISRAITPNISATSLSGVSSDAPYDLNTFNGLTYSQVDFTTGFYRFNTDPTTLGLQNLASTSVVFGSGSNKLFGSDSATGVIDFSTLTAKAAGIFTITGGEGLFAGATGILNFSEVDALSLDPAVPTRARASVSGSFQTVPEPRTDALLVGMSTIGAGVLLRRCSQKVASKQYG